MSPSERVAKRDIVTSRRLHDHSDRVNDDLRLIDGHDVTGVLSDDQTSSFRERGLISLQLPPIRVGSSSTGDNHHGNCELAARGPDFGRAFADMPDFVRRRLISRSPEFRSARELLNRWRQRFRWQAERDAEQSKGAHRG